LSSSSGLGTRRRRSRQFATRTGLIAAFEFRTTVPGRSAAALVAHHPLDHALAGLGDLALLAEPVGAVGAYLASLASDLDGNELGHLVVALAAERHESMVLATARGCTHIDLGGERGGHQLDLTQAGLGDRVERVEQLDDAALPAAVGRLGHRA